MRRARGEIARVYTAAALLDIHARAHVSLRRVMLHCATLTAEELVVWDELGAGIGSRIALSDGAEAAQPFRPENKPVDAYNAAILDSIEIRLP